MKFRFFGPLMLASVFSLVSSFSLAKADTDTNLSVRMLESGKKALVKAWNLPDDRAAMIRIIDQKGTTIYREQLKASAYARKYDFSQLEAGSYQLILSSGTLNLREKFDVSEEGTVSFREKKSIEEFRPVVIRRQDGKVDVLMQNRFDEQITIKLLDRKGNIMHKDGVAPRAGYARRLNLEQLKRDTYTLQVSGERFSYTEEISLF